MLKECFNKDRKFYKSSKYLDNETVLRWRVARDQFFIEIVNAMVFGIYSDRMIRIIKRSLHGVTLCKKGYTKPFSHPLLPTPTDSHPLSLIFNPFPLMFSPLLLILNSPPPIYSLSRPFLVHIQILSPNPIHQLISHPIFSPCLLRTCLLRTCLLVLRAHVPI